MLGNQALEEANAVKESVVIGHKAMQEATGSKNVIIGFEAGKKGSGSSNTVVGNLAFKSATTAGSNTIVGTFSGEALTEGSENTLVGVFTGPALTTGAKNVAVGLEALKSAKTGERNTILGYSAGELLTGSENVFIGHKAGKTKTAVNKTLVIANNETLALIEGKMSATAAEQELGFYGVTPVKRAATFSQGAFKKGTQAFETEAEAKAVVENIQKIITVLKNIGLME